MTPWEEYKRRMSGNNEGGESTGTGSGTAGSSQSGGSGKKTPWQDYKERMKGEKQKADFTATATKKEPKAVTLPKLSYPKVLSVPTGEGYFSYPGEQIQKDRSRFEELYRADNKQYLSGVKDTVAPYYIGAMEAHRSSQEPYQNKGYPGITSYQTEPVADLEAYIEPTEDFYDAAIKYAKEVLPYGERAGKTAQAAQEYEASVPDVYDAWRSRVRTSAEVQSEIDLVTGKNSVKTDNGISGKFGVSEEKLKLLEEEKDWASYFEYEKLLDYNLEAGQKKIDDLSRAIELKKNMDSDAYADPSANRHNRQAYQRILKNYGLESTDDLDDLVTQETVMFNRSKVAQKEAEMASVVDNPDFAQYSQAGAAIENPSYWDAIKGLELFGWRPFADDVQNKVTFARDNAQALYDERMKGDGNAAHDPVVDHLLRHVNDEEAAIYNYYLAKYGEDKADEYLETIYDKLNQREAAGEYARVKGNTGLELMYAATVGADQFKSGILGMGDLITGSEELRTPSAIQYAGQMVRQDVADRSTVGAVAYDVISTTTNMVPSILASTAIGMVSKTAGVVAGNTLLGASAAGNAYTEKINAGYSKEQARDYGLLVGASEIVLEYALGGISKLGGGALSKVAIKGLDKVDNVLARVAKSTGGKILMNAGSEAFEEGVQSILEPYIWQAVSGEEGSVDWEETLYSSLLGFITGGVFEGGEAAVNATASKIVTAEQNKVNKALDLLGKVDENTDAYSISRALHTVGASMTEENIAAVIEELENQGVSKEDAQQISKALEKAVNGKRLTSGEKKLLQQDSHLGEMLRTNLQRDTSGTVTPDRQPLGASVQSEQATNQAGTETQQVAEAPKATTVKIKGVDSTNDLDEGSLSVESERFETDEEIMRRVLSEHEIPEETIKALVEDYDGSEDLSPELYARATAEAFYYGEHGIPKTELATGSGLTPFLTERQRNYAYEHGRITGQTTLERENQMATGNGARSAKATQSGRVQYEGTISTENRSKLQEVSLQALDKLAESLGINVYLFESQTDAEGKPVGENGWYDPKTGDIHIDLNAGEFGQGTILFTAAHELTHFIRQWSPAKFKVLSEFLMEKYAEKGISVSDLVRRQQEKARRNGRKLSYGEAYEEMIADSMETMLSDGAVLERIQELKAKDKGLIQKIRNWLRSFAAKLRKAYNSMDPDTAEGKLVSEMAEAVEQLHELFAQGLVEASENFNNAEVQKNTTDEGGVMYSVREGMTEEQRYNELKDRDISIVEGTFQEKYIGSLDALDNIPEKAKSKAEKIIIPLAEQLGILNKTMKTPEVDIEFVLSKNKGLKESLSKQLRYGGSYRDFANALINLDSILENAILIEVHKDKYEGTSRENRNLEAVYVLFGAFKTDKYIIPVQSEIKKVIGSGGRLYMTVAMTKIEAGVLGSADNKNRARSLIPAPITCSIAEIFRNINPSEKHFLKYLPDAFLTEQQKTGKYEALREDAKRIAGYSDTKYLEAVKSGDMETAQRMVEEAAERGGYTIRAYHGTPNGSFNEFKPWQYFTESKEYADRYQNQGASSISYKKTADNPRTYGVFLKSDNPFDTRNAKERGIFQKEFYQKWGNGTPLSERGLPDWTDGEDMVEFFEDNDYQYDAIYLDEGGTGGYGEAVRDRGVSIMIKSAEQIKSADPVVYDNDGNVIPLSERFNEKKTDIRYSLRGGLKADLQKVKDRTFPSAHGEVEIGNTSDFLVNELDAEPLIVTMPATKAYRAIVTEEQAIKDGQPTGKDINYHGLGVDGLYNILARSETPLVAFADTPSEENKRGDRLVLVTDVNISGGLGVVVVQVETDTKVNKRRIQKANKTITAYDKSNAVSAVQEAYADGRLLYIDKKKGHLFNSGGKGANCPTAISEGVRKKNIQDFWANVKWENTGDSEMFFDGGNQYETAVAAAFKNAGKLRSDRGNLTTRAILTDLDASTVENETERNQLVEYQENSRNHLLQQKLYRKAQSEYEALSKEKKPDKQKMIRAKSEATKAKNRMTVYAERLEKAETGMQLRRLINREVKKVLSTAVSTYGAIPAGENPATNRVVEMPKSMDGKTKVSRVARSAAEANMTPNDFVPMIEEAVANGFLSYDPDTNKAQLDRAHKWFEYNGWDDSLFDWMKDATGKKRLTKDDIARGIVLYNNLANQANAAKTEEERMKHGKNAIRVLTELQAMATEQAQALQAMRIMKKQGPEMQYFALQKSVKKIEDELTDNLKKKLPEGIKLNETLVAEWIDALRSEDESRIEVAQKALYRDIAAQVPVTFREKWNTWRYLAMLLNPRTHIRNILGNAGFAPVRLIKNSLATGMEAIGSGLSGGRMQRTKAVLNLAGQADRALWRVAREDYKNVEALVQSGGKYNDNANDKIMKERRIFKSRVLEWLRKLNEAGLDKEDTWFSGTAYATALAGYLKAHGITADQIQKGTIAQDQLDRARAYAIVEAAKATYRDTNEFSAFISKIGKHKTDSKSLSFVDKTAGVLIEGVLPFRKTPANILVRGVGEYSPIGLLRGVKQLAWDVPHGNLTAAEGIDMLASGLTGTMLLGLGIWLCSIGLISGVEDDEEKRKFEQLIGHQNYALNVGDGSYTIDWLAPEALPVFVGVEIAEAFRDSDGTINVKTVLDAMSNISEPILEMSMLSGLNDLLDDVSYSDNKLMSILSTAATNYLTQFVPSIFGSIERTTEDRRYATYADKDHAILQEDWQYLIANLFNKAPVEYKQIPFVDAWGREEDTGDVMYRIVSNFISPGYYSKTENTPADDELIRLYDLGYESVFPERVKHSFKISYKDGENTVKRYLEAEEYVCYAKTKGQTGLDLLCTIFDSSWYKDLDDATKADAVEYAYSYANEVGKSTAVSQYLTEEGWEAKAIAATELGISPDIFIRAKIATSGIVSIKNENGNPISNSKGLLLMREIYKIEGLTDEQRICLFAAFRVGGNVISYSQKEVEIALKKMGAE